MKKEKIPSALKAIITVIAAGAIGLGGGAVLALADGLSGPGEVATEPGGDPNPRVKTEWDRNASGQTYGSLMGASTPDDAPDLIQVETTDGLTGYVTRVDLDEATGANVSNPEEAVAWEAAREARAGQPTFVPVYDVDGTTVIGEFKIDSSFVDPDSQR